MPKNKNSWSHPILGKFEFDGYEWIQERDFPEFNWGAHQSNYRKFLIRNGDPPSLSITPGKEKGNNLPPAPVIEVAEQLISNLAAISNKAVSALWSDLRGEEGFESGMWWHGDAIQAFELIENPPQIETDLKAYLDFTGISIASSAHGYGQPIATIKFESEIDVEHGIGILSDGNKIIGIGYSMDPSPFTSHRQS